MASSTRPLWLIRTLHWVSMATAILLVLALIGWLTVPSISKHLAEEQIATQIGRKATLDKIRFNPFTLTLTASDLTLYEPDKTTPAFSAKSLVLNVSFVSLFRLAPVLDQAKLINPTLHIVRTSTEGVGRYNFSDIIERILAMPKNKDPAVFSISNIQLENGTIRFDDKILDKHITIEALTIGLPQISNFPNAVDTFVQPHLSAKINGTPFALQGRSKPFASSQETTLAIDIDKLDIASYIAFSPVSLPLVIQSAKLSTKLDLRFIRHQDKPQILLSGAIDLDDVALTDKNTAPLLKAQAINAHIHQFNLLTGSMALDRINMQAPEVWFNLNTHGIFNWTTLSTTSKTSPKVASKSPKPTMTLAKFGIHHGTIHWQDAANAAPALNLQINNVMLDAKQLSLAANAQPATFTLSAGADNEQQIQFTGQINPAKATLTGQANIHALSLAQYQPYVDRALAAALSGQLSLKTLVAIEYGQVQLNQLGMDINDLKIAAKSRANGSISATKVTLENANLNTATHTFNATTLHLAGIQGDVQRDTNGKLNLQQFLTHTKPPAKTTGPQWITHLAQLVITDSTLIYNDKTVNPAVNIRADKLNLTTDNLSNQLDQSIKIALTTQINKSGKLAINGSTAPQMKSIQLTIDSQNLPVAALQPYFTNSLNATLTTGQISTKGKLLLIPPIGQQSLTSSYNGTLQLSNFKALDKENAANFLRWKLLDINGINLHIGTPNPHVTLAKIALNNFYARAILSSAGKLNLQNIVVSTKASTPPDPVTAPAIPAQPVSAPVAIAPTSTPIIKIGQITLANGHINYTDNFVKPNYTVNMTGVNGTIGAIASNQAQSAPINLSGKIDNEAPITISGTLNPLFKPMFLDIKGSANGVQLPRLTPYAAKYAGYAIEKGKLSMEVTYHVENDKLVAQNNVQIDQLTFGDKIDNPTATKLPVLLAVALLKDRHGQINVNLPISGTLSDPNFSVGGIIVRILVNLIAKAVTSPFALLNSAFSGEEELGYVEFAPGSAILTPATQSKLDTLAKALLDRPALKLDIIGRVDPATDTDGLRQETLSRKLKILKREETLSQGQEIRLADITLTDADKAQYMTQIYTSEKFDKPRNAIGLTKSLPIAEMEKLIITHTPITPDDWQTLATKRANVVRHYLETTGQIPLERIFLIAPKLNADGIKDKGLPNRVDFSLK